MVVDVSALNGTLSLANTFIENVNGGESFGTAAEAALSQGGPALNSIFLLALTPIVFVIGIVCGLLIMLFIRVAYFYRYDKPGEPSLLNAIFGTGFTNEDDEWFRRVFKGVKEKF